MKQIGIIFIMVIVWWTSSCSDQQTGGQQTHPDSTVVNVAVLPTMDCLPILLASEHGMFRRAGVQVGLTVFNAQMDVDTALTGGSAQMAVSDLVRAERLKREGLKLDYFTATNARWQLLTNHSARIKQLHQLYDKMMAMTRYSATDMLGDLAVDSAKLDAERVFRIQINDLNVRLQMLQMGIMDAMLLPEPQATEARNMNAFVLLDASERFDLKLGVVVMREGALTAHQKEAFTKAYNEACDSINANGLQAYGTLLSQRMGISRHTLDSLPQLPAFGHVSVPRERDVKRASDWLTKKKEKGNVEKQNI